MLATALVGSALLALLLPPGWGYAVAAPWLLAAGRARSLALLTAAAALLLLALGAQWAAPRADRSTTATPPPGLHAVALRGVWREPPAGDSFLETPHGPLAVTLADTVSSPRPGSAVELLARCEPDGGVLVVSVALREGPRGAWIDRWAQAAAQRARQVVGREHAGLVSGLVLGQREGLPFPILQDCELTGTLHLLALSGMNVMLLVAALQHSRFLRATLPTGTIVAAFVAIAGAQPPLVRAGLSWALARAGLLCGRLGGGALRRLAVVALLMECWQPGLHRELSAQLSFLAVAGLIAGARLVRGAGSGFAGGCGAFLATAPLCAEIFGRVQPLGVLVTMLLSPAVSLILIMGLLALLPLGAFSALDAVVGPALRLSAEGFVKLLELSAVHCPALWQPRAAPLPGWLLSLLVVAALCGLGGARALWPRAPRAGPALRPALAGSL
ncbi:MAG: ComEC/Rec2 family competence protein [Planctomycetota bacterium]